MYYNIVSLIYISRVVAMIVILEYVNLSSPVHSEYLLSRLFLVVLLLQACSSTPMELHHIRRSSTDIINRCNFSFISRMHGSLPPLKLYYKVSTYSIALV